MREQLNHLTATAAATLAENIDTANERALEAVVDANRKLVELAVTTADRVAQQISFELPFADRLPSLPTPAESGERYLDFVERAVAVNREFNDRVVAMLKSDTVTVDAIVAKINETADEAADRVNEAAAAVKQTAKRTASKTSARTAPARKAAAKRSSTATTTAKRTAKKAASTTAGATATAKRTASNSTAKKSTAKKSTAPAAK